MRFFPFAIKRKAAKSCLQSRFVSLDNIRHPLLPPIYGAALTFLIRIRAMPFIGGQPLPGVVALEHLPRRECGPIGVYVSRFCDDLVRTGSTRVG